MGGQRKMRYLKGSTFCASAALVLVGEIKAISSSP
jgi:hypothetical protein